ncbi:conjugal transfer protein TrbN [Thiolapillus sp.]|uniref:conjugal transfer protein TrbN n=3 Tax=Thiolapillus sp. TaxID=2017437 RepID=UPI0025EFFBEC|nr:conjugal transfer protein TrbN [Thiolapillus sp.]
MFFPALDVPPEQQEMVECAISAAIKYEIPANIMLAVAEKEGGKTGQWVRNSNGTYDVGYMQFNTAYLKSLKKYGIEAKHVAAGGCYSYDLAAWRISAHLRDGQKGDMWTRVANYHSTTPKFNGRYRADLITKAVKWGEWLKAHYHTVETAVETTVTPRMVYKPESGFYTPRRLIYGR